MSINTTVSVDVSNTTVNSSVFGIQTPVHSTTSDILNCVTAGIAVVGVVFGCFVANIVRKLDDTELRSRFLLLSILICDVILTLSNLPLMVFVFTLINRKRFEKLTCPFVYVNLVVSSHFSMSLVLSLLCLALDQVIAVFKPLYFRTSEGTRRKVVYGVIICMPVPLASAMLIYWTQGITETSDDIVDCESLTKAASEVLPYQAVIAVPLAVSTPVIYAVVLWKISRQRCVHSDNPLGSIQNRRLVVSFLFLSASYVLLWLPTLAYFSGCYYSGNGCWEEESNDVSLLLYAIFTLNYIVDPVTCAVRMEPIKQRIILMFRSR
ncbi:uncharacterized protein LOC121384254 [Gigantopelta aegis]|uniref:uncharacterized protein LOC121384254 n=1 Tax=Gigantopelta aegis TaxID=1735272 RepID=UPI001B88A440|nr:uncharacterized protein LOC121384254 [Gigantopelta aegis]